MGYVLATVAFFLLFVVLSLSFRGGALSWAALALALTTTITSAIFVWFPTPPDTNASTPTVANAMWLGSWFGFIGALLMHSRRPSIVRTLIVVGHGLWLALVAMASSPGLEAFLNQATFGFLSAAVLQVLAAVLVLVLVEQVVRAARETSRKAVRYYGLGLGIPVAYDLSLAAHSVLFGDSSFLLSVPRGYVFAVAAPLLAVGLQRTRASVVGIFVSRQVVFYSTSVLASGAYLTAMALVGYSINSLELRWGALLQVAFITASLALFVWLLYFEPVRAWLKVWLHKHFFENRYDYREEWLRLTQTLSGFDDGQSLPERSVRGLAQIVGAEVGSFWNRVADGEGYICEYSFGKPHRGDSVSTDHPLMEFVEQRRWVLDLGDAHRHPDRYESIEHAMKSLPFGEQALLVPLQYEDQILGVVELDRRNISMPLNYEDHDLLATCGRQIASHLAQRNTARQLAESRQFEAFNKLTAFLMHDLNNLIGQQRLIVQNATKHRDDPAFVDDAFTTIDNSVQRMDRLLKQLRERSTLGRNLIVDLPKLLSRAVARSKDRAPVPELFVASGLPRVHGDPDRLEAVISHMLRNAQEATGSNGKITIEAEPSSADNSVLVTITDNGAGMTAEFIRDQLFSPFVSTKGSQGMGIGVYQTREYLRSIGGDVSVRSAPGAGTTMALSIPAADK